MSHRIKTLLADRGILLTGSSLAHRDWRKDGAVLEALTNCDAIIINGEGTLHDGAKGGLCLLEMLDSPFRRGRPVALINALWQNNPRAWSEIARRCSIISVRDSQSAAELSEAGVPDVRLVPDLSLTGAFPKQDMRRDAIIIGDSVRLGSRKLLAWTAQKQNAIYMPTKTLTSLIWKNKQASTLLWRTYNWVWDGKVPNFYLAQDEDDYIRKLQIAKSHITGRFHGVCLSLLTQTPFLALASKTSKVQTLIKDVGLDKVRLLSDSMLAANFNITAPAFQNHELLSIRKYVDSANVLAEKLFDDIRDMA